jgi:hypothetical protein
MSDTVRRAVLILGVLAVLVGIGVASDNSGGPVAAAESTAGEAFTASGLGVTPSGAESSAWFCAGGTGAGGDAQSTMIFTNTSPRPVTGTVTTVASGAAASSTPVLVPPDTQEAVAPTPTATADPVASTVVLSGGGVGVTQVVTSPLGVSSAPCASSTASSWYFADGSTAGGAALSLALFNPTDTVAVVDVTFISSGGVLAPPAYQGIEVPGNSLAVENVGLHIRNQAHLATAVVALSGALVATETETAGTAGDGGTSVVLGAPSPATTWTLAQNTEVAGGAIAYHVYNPSDRLARVTVWIGLEQGLAEPLVLRVAAQSIADLDPALVPRIPSGAPFSVTFVSAGGVGIVVDREMSSPTGTGPPERGRVAAVPGGADRWLLPTGDPPSTGVESLSVVNLNPAPVTVTLLMATPRRLVTVPGFRHRRLRFGSPLIVTPTPGSAIGSGPLELVSSAPVAVEVDGVPTGSAGVTVIPALPLR